MQTTKRKLQSKMHNAKCKMQSENANCNLPSKMQNAKCKLQNANCKMQNAKCEMRNAKCKCKLGPPERSAEQSPPSYSIPTTDLTHARTHERNETISRLGSSRKGLGPPPSDFVALFEQLQKVFILIVWFSFLYFVRGELTIDNGQLTLYIWKLTSKFASLHFDFVKSFLGGRGTDTADPCDKLDLNTWPHNI